MAPRPSPSDRSSCAPAEFSFPPPRFFDILARTSRGFMPGDSKRGVSMHSHTFLAVLCRSVRAITLSACALLVGSVAALAQSDRGTITGTISDPAGAVVANAAVEARNTDTGAV